MFEGLQERGMRLAHYEPNFLKPELVTVAGYTFPIYSELVWVNVKLKDAPVLNKIPAESDFDEVELS